MAASVGIILAHFYHRTDYYDTRKALPEGQPIQKVISDLLGAIGDTFAEDVRCVVGERYAAEWELRVDNDSPFGPDTRYDRNISVNVWDFEKELKMYGKISLKTETRYFNKSAERLFASIFEGIDGYARDLDVVSSSRLRPGTDLTMLYRAREFQSELELREAIEET